MHQKSHFPQRKAGKDCFPISVNDNQESPLQTETEATDATTAPTTISFIRRIWAPATVAFGLGLTVIWAVLLGYGLIKLIHLAF
jgi:hypothetical protein